MKRNVLKRIYVALMAMIMSMSLIGCSSNDTKDFQKIEDFSKARIGIMTGSSHDGTVKEMFPDAEPAYFNTIADMALSVRQGKIDCYIEDEPFLASIVWEDLGVKRFEEPVKTVNNGFAFPQSEDSRLLREQVNEFIAESKENGTIDELKKKWLGNSEPAEHPDMSSLTGENGTIYLAVNIENKPMVYLKNENYTGFEIEFLTLFGEKYGYNFKIDELPFESIIAGVTAGKYDMASASLNITPEREESVDFSDPYTQFDVVFVVKDDGKEESSAMEFSDINNSTIGIVTGTSWDIEAQKLFPDAERKYFSNVSDVILALEQGKVDVFFADKTNFSGMQWENPDLTYIDEPIKETSSALVLAKEGYDEELLSQINTFIAKSRDDGTLEKLEEKWFSGKEPSEHPDYSKLTGENGTLRIAVSDSMRPVSYKKGSEFTGYEVDFITLFAEEYGYKLELQGMAFEALIPAIVSGKADIGACGITITPERTESVTFTDSHFSTYGIAVVRKENGSDNNELALKDFENATLGILSGSSFDPLAKERFPEAERKYYSLVPDMILAVEQGKIDGYISENTYVAAALWEGAKIKTVPEILDQTNAGYIFQKSETSHPVRQQLDEFIIKSKENGLIEELNKKWIGSKEPTEVFDNSTLTGENGTLKVAVSPDLKPLCYIKDGEIVGYEIEVLQHFAKEYGYKMEFIPMTFDAILPGVVAGKYDIGTGGMTITEERAQSVDFSESYLSVNVVMVVKDDDASSKAGYWDGIKEDFEKTFIREDRWKLIAEGVGVTMLISICSAVFGSLLGFALYMLSRSERKLIQSVVKTIAKVYSRIIAGTPVVVILMILFYVVFGNFRDMSGILVAILCFTLTFGAFVYSHMTVSVDSVDRGQTEASYALGYTKNKTFFRIIFPQAMTIFLPSYCSQAVELIKATAVVGYVAVNDLTKMGDIIRSNTYEAFFPLIATAVIYFILTWILSLLLKLVKLHYEPKRRSKEKILKGVKTV